MRLLPKTAEQWTTSRRHRCGLLVTAVLLPLVATSVYFYVALLQVGEELLELRRMYERSMSRERVATHLEAAAQAMDVVCQREQAGSEEDSGACEALMARFQKVPLVAGEANYILLYDAKAADIIVPMATANDVPSFLRDSSRKKQFLKMITKARPGRIVQGYFCEDAPFQGRSSGDSSRGMWYVTAAASGQERMLVSVIPDDALLSNGNAVDGAFRELLRRKGSLFLAYALGVGIVSACLIGVILLYSEPNVIAS